MLSIETDLSHDDEATLRERIAVLPPSWQARILRKKPFDARLRSAVAYTLLSRILRETYRLTALPALLEDAHGKPYLEGTPLHFSISHCHAAVACIAEDTPVAVDVQDILYDRCDRLKARIAAPHDPRGFDDRALTALWTQKEASAKLDGRGLTIPLDTLPLSTHRLETTDHGEFILTIARENTACCSR